MAINKRTLSGEQSHECQRLTLCVAVQPCPDVVCRIQYFPSTFKLYTFFI